MSAARRIEGRTGFLVTTGRPRIATLEGRTYVVGRGKSHEVADMKDAQKKLTELLSAEKAKRLAKRAAPPIPAPPPFVPVAPSNGEGLAPGKRVRFSAQPGGARVILGFIDEVGARSILLVDDEGNPFRRAAGDVELAPDALP